MAASSNTPGHPVSPISIDCDDCVMQHTPVCDDCVVTFLCAREPGEAVVIQVEDIRALRRLGEAGLAPALRHRTAG